VRIVPNAQIQSEGLLIVEAGGTYNYHWVLKGLKVTIVAAT
jgi:hypothetical protein